MTTTTKERDLAPTGSALAKLRSKRWYQQPMVGRLVGTVAAAVLLDVMSGPQGSREDVFFSVDKTLGSLRVVWWIIGAVALWAIMEFTKPLYNRYLAASVGPLDRFHTPVTGPVRGLIAQTRATSANLRRIVWVRIGFSAVVIGLLILLPNVLSTFWNQVLVNEVAIYVLLAIGLNVVIGWAGLLDLGFIAFFAIGAYSTAYWTGAMPVEPPFTLNAFLVIPVAVGTCLLAGLLLGAPTLRLRGDYLAIVTLGFHEIIYLIAKNADGFTNGPRGVQGISNFGVHVGPIDYDWELDPVPYWYLLIGIATILIIAFLRLEHSRVGRAWTAIREDEVAASATGVPTVKFKLMAFAIGASTSGIAGVVYASKARFISPESFLLLFSVLVVAYVIFGGMGSLWGVIIGTAFLAWLPQYMKDWVNPNDRFMYLGALLIIMMIYRPQGLIPSVRRKRELSMAKAGLGDADAMSEPAGGRMT
ncbi:branched-chain amino acid ABC transporter permease [Embleya sp. NPDC005575]|uniref:branched-chain amino acid ABC transporter permease n=1 Tax=Embleya sp. NPDC005575 TaxID=3156892 RepID=UPI0033B17E39